MAAIKAVYTFYHFNTGRERRIEFTDSDKRSLYRRVWNAMVELAVDWRVPVASIRYTAEFSDGEGE